ncbi:MAG: hypothetical protein ACFFB5_23230 [Promethearchaeota archaeon]
MSSWAGTPAKSTGRTNIHASMNSVGKWIMIAKCIKMQVLEIPTNERGKIY